MPTRYFAAPARKPRISLREALAQKPRHAQNEVLWLLHTIHFNSDQPHPGVSGVHGQLSLFQVSFMQILGAFYKRQSHFSGDSATVKAPFTTR